jgi:His/Glu/Gln/Arg/opine family amino acid ABC transporter permease subunit
MNADRRGELRFGRGPSPVRRWILAHPRLSRATFAVSVVVVLLTILAVARVTKALDPNLWQLLERPLVDGARNTIIFSLTIIPLGLGIGFSVGWARFSRHPIISWPATVYVDFIRGVPPLVLILFAFFWIPSLFAGASFESGLWFAVFALAMHTGAYQAEIFRAGFQSVARGQIEAGEAVGLSKGQVMSNVILPQTFRVTLPALGNEFALVIKDSSLLSIVGANDLAYWGKQSELGLLRLGSIEWVMLGWLIIALVYFVVTYMVTQAVGAVEQSYRVPGLGSVAF